MTTDGIDTEIKQARLLLERARLGLAKHCDACEFYRAEKAEAARRLRALLAKKKAGKV